MNDLYYLVLVSDFYVPHDFVQIFIKNNCKIFFRRDCREEHAIVCEAFSNGHTDLGTITLNFYFEPLSKNFIKSSFINY